MRRGLAAVVLAGMVFGLAAPARSEERTRIAVVGDSISKNRTAMGGRGWPLYLGKLLGDGYDVQTFSANGVTCLRAPVISVWKRAEITHAAKMKPNIVIIMLGANMGKPGHHQYKGQYAGDYRALIAHFQRLDTKPKVYVCTPIPIYQDNYGIEGAFVRDQITPIIRNIAKEDGLPLIDTYTPLKDQEGITTDGIHPSVKGMQAIAAIMYENLLGKAPPAERVAELAKEWQNAEAPAGGEKAKPEARPTGEAAGEGVPTHAPTDVPRVIELSVAAVRDLKGTGPDGKANTADDTWGFWFEFAHAPGTYGRLDLATEQMTEHQRKNGIPGKVTGPIGSWMPNKEDTEGWILHTDWDGRFEGVWGDKKANQVILYPYVEKGSHRAVAVTCLVPAAGTYTITGVATDLQVQPEFKQHDGISWTIEVADAGGKGAVVAQGGPIGDGHDRPDSAQFKAEKVQVEQGKLIRLAIHPNKWWGSDMTSVTLRIERLDK